MLDGSIPGPAWLWLRFLSSHGIAYGSSLPPAGACMTPLRCADAAVAHPASEGAPIEAAASAPRSRLRRPVRRASYSPSMPSSFLLWDVVPPAELSDSRTRADTFCEALSGHMCLVCACSPPSQPRGVRAADDEDHSVTQQRCGPMAPGHRAGGPEDAIIGSIEFSSGQGGAVGRALASDHEHEPVHQERRLGTTANLDHAAGWPEATRRRIVKLRPVRAVACTSPELHPGADSHPNVRMRVRAIPTDERVANFALAGLCPAGAGCRGAPSSGDGNATRLPRRTSTR